MHAWPKGVAVPPTENLHRCSIQSHFVISVTSSWSVYYQLADIVIQTCSCRWFLVENLNFLANFGKDSDITSGKRNTLSMDDDLLIGNMRTLYITSEKVLKVRTETG